MCDNDGSEDFIEDIVEDLIGASLDKCFNLYLERQLLPFTVTQAKDYILSIIDVCILILGCHLIECIYSKLFSIIFCLF